MHVISESIEQLAQQIKTEIDRLTINGPEQKKSDALIYIGHWQDAISRSIWVDPVLDAVDIRCWGLIRTQAVSGSAVILSLNQLLKSQLHYSKATLSKVIYVLRLTRWISLCSEQRSNDSGQFKNKIYAIHDAPLAIQDGIYLDSHYLEFVRSQLTHANKKIRKIAQSIWKAIHESVVHDNYFLNQPLSQPINDFIRQLNQATSQVQFLNLAKNDTIHRVQLLNLGKHYRVHYLNPVIKNDENIKKQLYNDPVQKMNPAPCSSLYININNKTTTTYTSKIEKKVLPQIPLVFPKEFNHNEIKLAEIYLTRIEPELQQAFLDEAAGQIQAKRNTTRPIRNPIAYLSWLCHEHGQGRTLLTSLGVRYCENRERKTLIEQQQLAKQTSQPDSSADPTDLSSVQTKAAKNRILELRASLNATQKRTEGGGTVPPPSTITGF